MARPKKMGLDYFPLDVDMAQDDKIELIEAQHGIVGFALIIRLLMLIYKNGYYYRWTEKEHLLFSKRVNVNISEVNVIINDCIKWGIFDSEVYEKQGILTSCGIQKRYLEAVGRRQKASIRLEYLLLSKKIINDYKNVTIEVVNVDNNPPSEVVNDDINPQSKVKESKVKESKVKKSKVKEDNVPSVQDETFEQPSPPVPKTKVNYQEVYEYYLTLDLIKHKNYTVAMAKAIKKAMKDNKYTIEDCKKLLKRHEEVCEATKNNGKYRVTRRGLDKFFGQKIKDSLSLICSEYEDEGSKWLNYLDRGAKDGDRQGNSENNQSVGEYEGTEF